MFRKLIGLVLILIIFYLAIKALVFLPYFTNLIIGNNKSPFQVGTDYVNQINQIYNTNPNQQIKYGNNLDAKYIGRITLEKVNGKLILSIEGANTDLDLNVWLTNNPQITNQTEYVDFGKLYNSESIRQYIIDMKGGDISLNLYKYILLVDKDYNIYKRIDLN